MNAALPEHSIELYRALVTEAFEAMTVVDERGIIVFENLAAERLAGWGSGVGRCVFDLVHVDDLARVSEALSRSVVAAESSSRVSYRLRHHDTRWVMVESISHYVDGQSGPLAAIHTRDMSDIRHLEARLRHAQKLVTLGRMALGVADDFDDAIATIRLHLAAVLEVRNGEAPRFGVRAIQKAVADATALATQLRVFAQTTPVFDERVNVNVVLHEIRRLVATQLWLSVTASATHSVVLIDRGSLREAMTDLVFAFRSATPPDSAVAVSSSNLPVSAAPRHFGVPSIDYVVIEVKDSRVSAEPDATEGCLFEPSAVKPNSGALMLSLVILHDIVSYAGGFIEVMTHGQTSTMVRVFLPAEIA